MSIYLTEAKNNNEIWLFKRDKEGKKTIEQISNFKPYLYVPENEDVSNLLGVLKVEKGFIDLFNKPLKKVSVTTTKFIPHVREAVSHSYESDILFNTILISVLSEIFFRSKYRSGFIFLNSALIDCSIR